jgi:hypothetical protein
MLPYALVTMARLSCYAVPQVHQAQPILGFNLDIEAAPIRSVGRALRHHHQ